MITRRGLLAFLPFLIGVLVGAAWMGHTAADALSTGYGGASRSCVTQAYSVSEYAVSGVITKCGPYWHEGGPVQS